MCAEERGGLGGGQKGFLCMMCQHNHFSQVPPDSQTIYEYCMYVVKGVLCAYKWKILYIVHNNNMEFIKLFGEAYMKTCTVIRYDDQDVAQRNIEEVCRKCV